MATAAGERSIWTRTFWVYQPPELAAPRRKVTTAGLALGLGLGLAVGLASGDLVAGTVAGTLGGGPLVGWAQWRWPTWSRRRPSRWVGLVVGANAGFQALRLVTDGDKDPLEWALGVLVVGSVLAVLPGFERSRQTHPAPAGWFVDPAGRFPHRWWRGDRWTDDVLAPGDALEVDPEGAPATTVANAPR